MTWLISTNDQKSKCKVCGNNTCLFWDENEVTSPSLTPPKEPETSETESVGKKCRDEGSDAGKDEIELSPQNEADETSDYISDIADDRRHAQLLEELLIKLQKNLEDLVEQLEVAYKTNPIHVE